MFNLSRIVIWLCKKFNREQLQVIIGELNTILDDPNAEVQPKDTFKEDHPNYRGFDVDPNPPLKQKSSKKKRETTKRS